MSTKEYRKPGIFASEFTCPHCKSLIYHESLGYLMKTNLFTEITEKRKVFELTNSSWKISNSSIKYSYEILERQNIEWIVFIIRICLSCGKRCYFERILYSKDSKEEDILICPQQSSLDIEPNEDMDKEDKDLFNEAKDIYDRSPKAAGALLRSILESILKKVFKDKLKESDNTLHLILKNPEVQKILSKEITTICHACRLIGNKASHSLLIDMNEQREQVELLFTLINLIAKKIISDPLEEKKLYEKSKVITHLDN